MNRIIVRSKQEFLSVKYCKMKILKSFFRKTNSGTLKHLLTTHISPLLFFMASNDSQISLRVGNFRSFLHEIS